MNDAWWADALLVVATVTGIIAAGASYVSSRLSARVSDRLEKQTARSIAVADEKAALANADAKIAQAEGAKLKNRTAQLELEAAQARERAARYEREAAILRRALSRTKEAVAGRTVSDKQRDALVRELRGQSMRIAICHDGSPEAEIYAWELASAFDAAGQKIVNIGSFCQIGIMSSEPVGVVFASPSPQSEAQLDGDPLYRALVRTGLYGGFEVTTDQAGVSDARLIMVPRRGAPTPKSLDAPFRPPAPPKIPE